MTSGLSTVWPEGSRAPEAILQIAHRGGAGGVEDYRRAQLARVAALGAHLVVVDVRVTGDDHVVVHHDPEILVDGHPWRISEHRARDLRTHVPHRVHDALTLLGAVADVDLGVYVDIKSITRAGLHELLDLLAATGLHGRAILASARAEIVAECAALAPGLPRAILVRPAGANLILDVRLARASFVHPCWEHADDPVARLRLWLDGLRQDDIGVITWREERPNVLHDLVGLGVDGICTDDPALLAATIDWRSRAARYAQRHSS